MIYWYVGAPLLVLLMVGNQGLRSTGDTRSPAMIMALAAIINLILDPLLILVLGRFTFRNPRRCDCDPVRLVDGVIFVRIFVDCQAQNARMDSV